MHGVQPMSNVQSEVAIKEFLIPFTYTRQNIQYFMCGTRLTISSMHSAQLILQFWLFDQFFFTRNGQTKAWEAHRACDG